MRYCVDFEGPAGEQKTVLVALSCNEERDVARHLAMYGPGGPNGPLAKGYAVRRAALEVPCDFHFVEVRHLTLRVVTRDLQCVPR
jgi:hypothetical protein